MISCLKPTDFNVLSLTTIASPHHGSAFADYMFESNQGGAPTTLVANQPRPGSLVVDATSLYWIDNEIQQLDKLTPK